MTEDFSTLKIFPPITAFNAGLMISRGHGIHPVRTIDSQVLIFVRDGTLSMREEQREFEVVAGDSLLLNPGREHGGTRPFPPDLQFYWVHFESLFSSDAPPVEMELQQHTRIRRPDHLGELFRRFLDDQETGSLSALSGAFLIGLMLCEVAASVHGDAKKEASRSAHTLASRAETIIRTQFSSTLTSRSLSETVACNPDYLNRIYKQGYGRTITEGIRRSRLTHVCKLLRETALPLHEIAEKSGFDDVGYLRRLFKRDVGTTASAYRRSYSRIHINTE